MIDDSNDKSWTYTLSVSKTTLFETLENAESSTSSHARADVTKAVSKGMSQKSPGVTGSETVPAGADAPGSAWVMAAEMLEHPHAHQRGRSHAALVCLLAQLGQILWIEPDGERLGLLAAVNGN